jgi:hypothetical protein
VLALRGPWGVPFDDIRCPVLLWHGSDDQFSPVEHTLWLHRRIQGSELTIAHGVGHFGAMEVLPEILAEVARRVRGGDHVDLQAAPEAARPSPEEASQRTPPEITRLRPTAVSRDHADRSPGRAAVPPAAW